MAKTSQIAVTLSGSGDGIQAFTIAAPTISNSASPLVHDQHSLTTGANTLTVPTGATYLVVVPPAASTVAKTLKGVSGDTGIALTPGAWCALPIASGVSSIVINAASGEVVDLYWW
jgi:hypothetical protein